MKIAINKLRKASLLQGGFAGISKKVFVHNGVPGEYIVKFRDQDDEIVWVAEKRRDGSVWYDCENKNGIAVREKSTQTPKDLPVYARKCIKDITVPAVFMENLLPVAMAVSSNAVLDPYTIVLSNGTIIGAGESCTHPYYGFFQHCGEVKGKTSDHVRAFLSNETESAVPFDQAKEKEALKVVYNLYYASTDVTLEEFFKETEKAWLI